MSYNQTITLHCGQAGLQMGHAVWEALAAENDVTRHGLLRENSQYEEGCEVFFKPVPSGYYVPRTVFIDTEPTVMDEIKLGSYRNLFHPDSLIAGNEDAANNFARGYYTLGHKMAHKCLDRIRYTVESCDNFRGFFTFQSSGGGTGSGLLAIIMEHMYSEFVNKTFIHTTILPGSNNLNDAIVEPYNTTLKIACSANNFSADLSFLVSNDSLYKICTNRFSMDQPTYTNINRLISTIPSYLAAPFRSNASSHGVLNELFCNLVPYPRINFPSLNYAPFLSSQSYCHEKDTTFNLVQNLFSCSHSLLNLNLENSDIMSSVLAFRGNHKRIDIFKSLDKIKRNKQFKFVSWCPTGFKVMHNPVPALHTFSEQPDKSVLMICNHSAIGNVLSNVTHRFVRLFHRRSFVHWYVDEGMEEQEMTEAYNVITNTIRDYKSVRNSNKPIRETEDASTFSSEQNKFTLDEIINREFDGNVKDFRDTHDVRKVFVALKLKADSELNEDDVINEEDVLNKDIEDVNVVLNRLESLEKHRPNPGVTNGLDDNKRMVIQLYCEDPTSSVVKPSRQPPKIQESLNKLQNRYNIENFFVIYDANDQPDGRENLVIKKSQDKQFIQNLVSNNKSDRIKSQPKLSRSIGKNPYKLTRPKFANSASKQQPTKEVKSDTNRRMDTTKYNKHSLKSSQFDNRSIIRGSYNQKSSMNRFQSHRSFTKPQEHQSNTKHTGRILQKQRSRSVESIDKNAEMDARPNYKTSKVKQKAESKSLGSNDKSNQQKLDNYEKQTKSEMDNDKKLHSQQTKLLHKSRTEPELSEKKTNATRSKEGTSSDTNNASQITVYKMKKHLRELLLENLNLSYEFQSRLGTHSFLSGPPSRCRLNSSKQSFSSEFTNSNDGKGQNSENLDDFSKQNYMNEKMRNRILGLY